MKPMSMDATNTKTFSADGNAAFLSKVCKEKKASNKKRASTLKSIMEATNITKMDTPNPPMINQWHQH